MVRAEQGIALPAVETPRWNMLQRIEAARILVTWVIQPEWNTR
jgi:hypothetical protein